MALGDAPSKHWRSGMYGTLLNGNGKTIDNLVQNPPPPNVKHDLISYVH